MKGKFSLLRIGPFAACLRVTACAVCTKIYGDERKTCPGCNRQSLAQPWRTAQTRRSNIPAGLWLAHAAKCPGMVKRECKFTGTLAQHYDHRAGEQGRPPCGESIQPVREGHGLSRFIYHIKEEVKHVKGIAVTQNVHPLVHLRGVDECAHLASLVITTDDYGVTSVRPYSLRAPGVAASIEIVAYGPNHVMEFAYRGSLNEVKDDVGAGIGLRIAKEDADHLRADGYICTLSVTLQFASAFSVPAHSYYENFNVEIAMWKHKRREERKKKEEDETSAILRRAITTVYQATEEEESSATAGPSLSATASLPVAEMNLPNEGAGGAVFQTAGTSAAAACPSIAAPNYCEMGKGEVREEAHMPLPPICPPLDIEPIPSTSKGPPLPAAQPTSEGQTQSNAAKLVQKVEPIAASSATTMSIVVQDNYPKQSPALQDIQSRTAQVEAVAARQDGERGRGGLIVISGEETTAFFKKDDVPREQPVAGPPNPKTQPRRTSKRPSTIAASKQSAKMRAENAAFELREADHYLSENQLINNTNLIIAPQNVALVPSGTPGGYILTTKLPTEAFPKREREGNPGPSAPKRKKAPQ